MSTRLFSSINKGYINITLPKMDFSWLWLRMTCCWCDDRYVWQIMRQQVIYSCLNGGNLFFFLANTGNHFLAQHPALTACDYRRDEGSCPFVRTSDGASGWLVQTGSNTHLLTRSLWQRWERRHFRRGATALRARARARTVWINESLSEGHTFPFECTGLLIQVFGLLLLSETVCFISIFRHKHVDPVSLFYSKAGVTSDKEVFSYVILFRKIQTFYSQDISKQLYNIKWSFLKELLVR